MMNPILPNHYYIPDVEARVWKDGRIYLYGSYDICGVSTYCSDCYHVFSSSDMTDWHDHGESFNIADSHVKTSEKLYAPDCIYKDNRYYLLYCGSDNSEGIAVGNTPEGPFKDARSILKADKDSIDPAGFVDDDGSVYYFWGQNRLRGVRMKDDLSDTVSDTFVPELLTNELDGFHEGASIRKRNGIYYMLFTDTSRGKATALGYAISHSPLGPYEKKGIIIDNAGCDPETWNNHGSMAQFNGQWYVFYHRSSHGSKYNRRVCAEPIYFNDDGTVDEVEMTTQGAGPPLKADSNIEAFRACLLYGKVHTASALSGNKEYLTQIRNNDWAAFKYIDFDKGVSSFYVTASAIVESAVIEVRCDDPLGTVLCECEILPAVEPRQSWRQAECRLDAYISGLHSIFLVFKGGSGHILDLLDFSFK